MESELAVFRASIVQLDGQKALGACCGGEPENPPVDTSGEGEGHQAEEGGLWHGWPASSEAVEHQKGCSCGCSSNRCKNLGVGGVRGSYGERLSVGLEEVLANHQAMQEGKVGLGPSCVQRELGTAYPD